LRQVGEGNGAATLAAKHLLNLAHTHSDNEVAGRISESHEELIARYGAVFNRAEVRQTAHVRGRNPLRKPGNTEQWRRQPDTCRLDPNRIPIRCAEDERIATVPPMNASLPSPGAHRFTSFPGPPNMMSLFGGPPGAGPAVRSAEDDVRDRDPPSITSLPFNPKITSLPEPPIRTSVRASDWSVPAPA
jgi:hypothetical protein